MAAKVAEPVITPTRTAGPGQPGDAATTATGTFDTLHPLYFLAVYAPTLTAVVLTTARGRGGPACDGWRRGCSAGGCPRAGTRSCCWAGPRWTTPRVLQWVVDGEPISLRTRGSVLVAGVLVHLVNNVAVADL